MIIGGEFEVDPNKFNNSCQSYIIEFHGGYFYSSGRAAFYHILNSLKKQDKVQILLPDYLCESLVEIAKLAAVPFDFYNVNNDLTINIDSLTRIYRSTSSILLINYFGGIDIPAEIIKLKMIDSNVSVILNNVQAFFSMYENVEVDFMFTSFRKQLPVPDGAWVRTNHELFVCKEENTFAQYKLAGGLLKAYQRFESVDDQLYLDLFNKGEIALRKNINSKISDITLETLEKIDFVQISKKRKENSAYLIGGLHNLGLNSLLNFTENMTPLFVPLLIQSRDFIREELRKNSIFCPVHWPKFQEVKRRNDDLYDSELSLVIDQRYDLECMDRILSILKKYVNYGG